MLPVAQYIRYTYLYIVFRATQTVLISKNAVFWDVKTCLTGRFGGLCFTNTTSGFRCSCPGKGKGKGLPSNMPYLSGVGGGVEILTSALDWGWVVNATHRTLYPKQGDPLLIVQEAKWAQGRCGWVGVKTRSSLAPTRG